MSLPEPLQAFVVTPAVAEAARRVDDVHAIYRDHWNAGRILPNSVEAVRVELTYHSNAIEGSTLSLRDTQLVVEGREPNTGKSLREIYEARNHDRALRMVEAWSAARPPAASLIERDVLDIHTQIMADIDPAGAGRYRADRVLITGTRFVPPGPHKFAALIPVLLEMANEAAAHPAVRAAELHYNLVAVHPFGDGNGRTARLLMNYLLLRHGFPPTVIPVERRTEYLAALDDANAGRSEPFMLFVLSCVENSIRRLVG